MVLGLRSSIALFGILHLSSHSRGAIGTCISDVLYRVKAGRTSSASSLVKKGLVYQCVLQAARDHFQAVIIFINEVISGSEILEGTASEVVKVLDIHFPTPDRLSPSCYLIFASSEDAFAGGGRVRSVPAPEADAVDPCKSVGVEKEKGVTRHPSPHSRLPKIKNSALQSISFNSDFTSPLCYPSPFLRFSFCFPPFVPHLTAP